MLFPRLRTEKMARLRRAAKSPEIIPNPSLAKGEGGIYRQTFLSYKHVCINEALSAYT